VDVKEITAEIELKTLSTEKTSTRKTRGYRSKKATPGK